MWTNVKKIAYEAKFYVGAAIKIMPTSRGLEAGNFIPEGGLVYLVADSALDKSYFNCVCLSEGECGNVICCLQREGNFVTGKQIKRMFESELQEAFVSEAVAIRVTKAK